MNNPFELVAKQFKDLSQHLTSDVQEGMQVAQIAVASGGIAQAASVLPPAVWQSMVNVQEKVDRICANPIR